MCHVGVGVDSPREGQTKCPTWVAWIVLLASAPVTVPAMSVAMLGWGEALGSTA